MEKMSVIAIFDIGKTNKKLFLFDPNYKIVYERSEQLPETADEDGDVCEDVDKLTDFIYEALAEVVNKPEFDVKAVNFSGYGASLVNIGANGKPVTPLYNYLKPFPENLSARFYDTYGGKVAFPSITASPILGSLNSGMQLYRLKYEKPELFNQIRWSLHLPQFLSFLISGKACSDYTSIGCHTNLWDFQKNGYHEWVSREGILPKLAPVVPSDQTYNVEISKTSCPVGVGLHDSSAALIPYLISFNEPFVLLSTGTWCISINPFNPTPLTQEELSNDCLCFLQGQGNPVKASRLFAGYEHEHQVERIASFFNQNVQRYKNISFDPELMTRINQMEEGTVQVDRDTSLKQSAFGQRDLSLFSSDVEAYHQLISDLIHLQYESTQLVIRGSKVKRIFVDGGFSKNAVYMNLLAAVFSGFEVFAASVAQASAMGAALAIHKAWNPNPVPADLIELKFYSITQNATL